MDSKAFYQKLVEEKKEELTKFLLTLTEAENEAHKAAYVLAAAVDQTQLAQDKLLAGHCTPSELELALKSYQIGCARWREKVIDIERQLTKGLELVQSVVKEHQPSIK